MADPLQKELEVIKKDKRRAENKGNLKEVAQLCNVIGEIYSKHGKHEDALEEHKTEQALSDALEDTIGSAIAHRKIGECYCQIGNYEEALIHQNKHLELSKICKNVLEEQRAWATIGRTYLFQSETRNDKLIPALHKAEKGFLKALELCERIKKDVVEKEYMEMKARLLLNLGLVFDNKGDLKRCSEYIKQAIHIAQKHKLHEDLYRCQYSLAGIYQRNNNVNQALRSIEDALQCAHKMKDKEVEIEALIQKAQLFVQLGDFTASKICLKKSHKLHSSIEQTVVQVTENLKAVIKLCKLEEQLKECQDDCHEEKYLLYEKLGDTLAKLCCFKQALENYKNMLQCAQVIRKPSKDFIPIYISLAQTCVDLKKYDQAIEYYRRELEYREDNHIEECKTMLNIAEAQELSHESYDVIVETYRTAYEHAKKVKHRKLQVATLKALSESQEMYQMLEDKEKTLHTLNSLKSKYGLDSDIEFSEDDEIGEIDNDDDDDDISLGDLSNSDISDHEEEYCNSSVRNPKRKVKVKLNEKGETPLHRACIEGNLKRIKQLIEQGHPVNPRDYCGWIPLHEAANHDHCDIVTYLLQQGAHVNDRGGQNCGGITPLHDAAGCGNLDVMRVLIEHGADAIAKDDEGNTALDSLVQFRQRSQADLDRQTLIEIKQVEKLLKNKMKDVVEPGGRRTRNEVIDDLYDAEDDLPDIIGWHKNSRQDTHSASLLLENAEEDIGDLEESIVREEENNSPEAASLQDWNQLSDIVCEDSENVYYNPDLHNITAPETANQARQAYRQAMSCIGSSATRIFTQQPVTTSVIETTSKKPALLTEEEIVGDDWLIEDVQPSKRKRLDVNDILTTNTTRKRNSDRTQGQTRLNVTDKEDIINESSDDEINIIHIEEPVTNNWQNSSTKHKPVKRKRTTQLRLTQFSSTCSKLDKHHPVVDNEMISTHHARDLDISAEDTNATIIPCVPSSVMRIKVRIKDKLLLIPVAISEDPKTICWLCREASHRYYTMTGMKPIFGLSTQDGAMLAEDDLVLAVLTTGEVVTAVIDHWDLPPLADRYTQACKAVSTVPYKNVKTLLASCDNGHKLSLENLALRSLQIQPILRALQCQSALKELYLQGNKIGDTGSQQLSSCLSTLTSLSILNISCNDLTHNGLKYLAEMFSPENNTTTNQLPLQMLQSFNVSFNPLGDASAPYLIRFIKNTSLNQLEIEGCDLTARFFQTHRMALVEACKNISLTSINIAHNTLGSTGVELLLRSLNCNTVLFLNLTGVVNSYQTNRICQHFEDYLNQPECSLLELDLSACCLFQESIQPLTRCVASSRSLQKLSLSCNPKISIQDLTEFLTDISRQQKCSLESLIIKGCGFVSPLTSGFIDAVNKKLNHKTPLKRLILYCEGLNKTDMDSLLFVWRSVYRDRTVYKVEGNTLDLAVVE